MQAPSPPIVESEAVPESQEVAVGRRTVQFFALFAAGLGVLVGVSWWFNEWQALSFGTNYVPMAPSTAFLFVVLATSLFASSRWPSAPATRFFNISCLSIVVLLSLLLGGHTIADDSILEHLIVRDIATSTGIPVGRMSPLTSLAFLVASAAFYCQWPAFCNRPAFLYTSSVLSWFVFLISAVTITGYASGSPPILGNLKIPLALLTACAFALISMALLLSSLTQMRLLQLLPGTRAGENIWWIVTVAVFCIVVAAALRAAIVGGDGADMIPYLTFYPAVPIVALSTGLAGGLLATLLSGIFAQTWIHGGTLSGSEWLALTVFLIGCTIITLICEAMRQSRTRERLANMRLNQEVDEHKQVEGALRESDKRFRGVFEQAAVGVARVAPDGTWLEVNEKLCDIVGYSREELLTKTFQDITHPDDLKTDLDYVNQLLKDELKTYSMEKRYFTKNGDIIWINLTGSLMRDTNNDPDYFVAIIEDITERKQAEEALRNNEEKFRALFEQAGGYCMILDPNTPDSIPVIIDANEAACLAHGYTREEFIGRPVVDIDDEGGKRLLRKRTAEIMTGKPFYVENTHVRKDGSTFSVAVNANRIDIGNEPPLIFTTEFDITDRKRAEELIEHQANFDSLTDLPNRRLLLDRVTHAVARCRRHGHFGAVLFIDMDNFKDVNDSLGHPIGDVLLQEVARRLQKSLREEDTSARLGGDEFVALFSELSDEPEEAAIRAQLGAEKLRNALSLPYNIHNHQLQVTPSIGIAMLPKESENANDILRNADTAMYRAKDAGRNAIRFFLPSMQLAAEERLKLQNDLRQAVEHDEFHLHFQPQVDIAGEIIGAEALLRWQQPEKGNVAPDSFISVAEETGQILNIGEWVLEHALDRLKAWTEEISESKFRHLAINVSPRQFRQANFAIQVERLLAKTGAKPGSLTLELTEGVLVEHVEDTIKKMDALKKLGVRFSIDDFGTGYSSLAYLKRLPLDEIKIDRSFVGSVTTESNDANLVETIITMAEHLGLEVIAEGVETEEQLDFLQGKGCRLFQGYYFSRPKPAEEFIELLRIKTKYVTG